MHARASQLALFCMACSTGLLTTWVTGEETEPQHAGPLYFSSEDVLVLSAGSNWTRAVMEPKVMRVMRQVCVVVF